MNEMPKHLKDFINFIECQTNNYKKSDLKVCCSQRQSILQSKNPEFSECHFFNVLSILCRKKGNKFFVFYIPFIIILES